MTLVWLDGVPASAIATDDRGLAYGDGLFETLSVQAGVPRLFERHLNRLELGCQRLAIPRDLALWREEIERFAAQLGTGVCKLILTRGSGPRGYAPPVACQPRRLLMGAPSPAYPAQHAAEGISLFPCTTRLAEQPLLAGLKHLNRLEQVLARAEWQDSAYAEGLMRDTSGRVIEGVFSNLFLVKDAQLLTPALQRCGVAGVMRAEILELAAQAGLSVRVRDIAYTELLQADEVFMCNSVYGIWPVRRLHHCLWPVGPLTRQLQQQVFNRMGAGHAA